MAGVLFNVLLLIAVICQAVTGNHRVKRIVGGRPAAVPPEDDPVVFVYLNDHDARVSGTRDRPDGYYNFRGIRYAEPPVGRFRFQRPRKLRLTGDVNATIPGPPCPQPDPKDETRVIGSEDCLFLNVFTPSLPDSSEGIPVVMWIHGGGYRRGSASQYGVRHLVNQKLVVVTIQYRLGSLGFLSAGAKELPGNAGMFDMATALEWIKDYITFFGGNPNKITVFGQGTGASSAMLLSLSQITQGFLSGVMAMSGTALSAFAIDNNPIATGRDLAKRNDCPTAPVVEMVKCLQELPVPVLIQADSGLQELRLAAQGIIAGITGLLGAGPCIEGENDGRYLPNFFDKSPIDALKLGDFPKIPLLTGVTKDETSSALLGLYRNDVLKNMMEDPNYVNTIVKDIVRVSDLAQMAYNKTDELITNVGSKYFGFLQGNPSADTLNKIVEVTGDSLFNLPASLMAKMWSKNGKSFFYSFEQKPNKNKHGGPEFLQGLPIVENLNNTNNGVAHGDDLPFIFDPNSLFGNASANDPGSSDPDTDKVRNITTQMVAQFARSGEPSIEGLGPWPAFSEDKTDYVTISSNPSQQSDFRFCQMALWGGIGTALQSTTCQTFWGITQFSEGALGTLGQAAGGVGSGISSAAGGVGSGISSAVNDTLTGNFLNPGGLPGLPAPQNTNQSTGGDPLNTILNPIQNPFIPLGVQGGNTNKVNSTADTQENLIIPVTERSTQRTTKRRQRPLIPTIPPLIPRLPFGLKK